MPKSPLVAAAAALAMLLLGSPAHAAAHPAHHSAARSTHHGAGHTTRGGTASHARGGSHNTRRRSKPAHGSQEITQPELPLDVERIAPGQFDAAATRFLHGLLAFTPVTATQAGYHIHTLPDGETRQLDHVLDDASLAGYKALCTYERSWLTGFEQLDAHTLDDQQRVDLAMLQDNLHQGLLECHAVEGYRHRPDQMAETLGDALLIPLSQDATGTRDGVPAALDRLAQFPRFLAQARQTLMDADPVYVEAATQEIDGTLDLVDHLVRERAAASPATARQYANLAPAAERALRDFRSWVTQVLAHRAAPRSWRLGGAFYTQQFVYTMHAAITPDQLLAQAEQELQSVRADMFELALAQHRRMHPGHGDHAELPQMAQQNLVIGEVLGQIATDHVAPADLRSHVESDLGGIISFIRSHRLLTLGSTANLKVIDTPAFLRASYSVAGFHAPPALDPQADAEYWVTPIGADVSTAAAESRLREYNNPTLKWLSIHEALPGHYVQFEHANRLEPVDRRLLRALLGNGAYVEGWAEYIAQQMMDAGYQADDWRFRLAMRKIRLRVLTNTILDVRLHTHQMSDAEALKLLTEQAFQTQAEAQGKLRRAKLSAVQLTTYYVGLTGWQALRRQMETRDGSRFDAQRFHDQALDQGPVPLALLSGLLSGLLPDLPAPAGSTGPGATLSPPAEPSTVH